MGDGLKRAKAATKRSRNMLSPGRIAKLFSFRGGEEGSNVRILVAKQTQTCFYLRGIVIESGEEFVLELRAND
jgi:hypothetical protein